jgi:heptosyltransferase-1
MKILIVKTSALGDLIHTFPVLSYLRNRFPFAQIDWVVEASFAELVEAHPHVTRVLTIESKKWRKAPFHFWEEIKNFWSILRETEYDFVFDLQGNVKSAAILAQARAKEKVGFGWRTVPEWPNALFTSAKINPPPGKNIREDYLAVVQGYFKDTAPYPIEPVVLRITEAQCSRIEAVPSGATLVCPGAAWPNKQLAFEQLLAFLKQLERGPYLFAWGTEHEREIGVQLAAHFHKSSVLERCTLAVLQHVMARCALVVAMDSLPLHLCATTPTPTIGFFGPSSAKKYGPIGERHHVIQGKCPYGIVFEKRCPKLRTCKTGACLKNSLIFNPPKRAERNSFGFSQKEDC